MIDASIFFDIDFRGPMTEEIMTELRRRNELKRLKALEYLGEKWVLHPANSTKKHESKSSKKRD